MRSCLPLVLVLMLAACGEGEPLSQPDALLPDGARYRGTVQNGLLQGAGRLDYANGSWFEGQFRDGQPEGPGEWRGANGERYVGEFSRGLFHGQGRLSYPGGSVYEGGFRLGQREGEGYLQQGGDSYRGSFSGNRYHGFGRIEYADGSSFQGQFVRGEPEGVGVRVDADGNQFSGTFRQGLLEGPGSYLGVEGDHYNGGFRRDQFHGKGRYQSPSGDAWSGRFKDGELTGKGEFAGADGTRYQGAFRRWQYAGEGELKLPDGSVYRGHFSRGEYAGEGTLQLADGSRQSGTWEAGRRIRDAAGLALADPLELGLLEQGRLLEETLAAVPPSTPQIELYSLTLAGDGQQSVFLREADYVSELLATRFAARGQIRLTNHRDHLADRPLATRENLARAVRTLAERSGKEDLLFIYLTSHGSRDHRLVLDQPRLQLADLPADELAQLLAPLRDRYKVLVVSACYSGGFIPPLQDERTLVITAARADRVSFGCSEEADFTYFGRALFAEALQQTDDLPKAFKLAAAAVAEREQREDFQASEPQIWAPSAVLAQWRKLREAQAAQALAGVAETPATVESRR